MKNMFIIIVGFVLSYYKAFALNYIWFWYMLEYTNILLSTNFIFIMLYAFSMIMFSNKDILKAREMGDEDTIYVLSFSFILSSMALFFAWFLK